MRYLIYNKTTGKGRVVSDYATVPIPVNDHIRVIAIGGVLIAESLPGSGTLTMVANG